MKFRGPLDEPPVSESDIQAYSDGTLAGARAAHVRRYLAGSPAEWHRILFYRRLNEQIRDAYPAQAAQPRAGRRQRGRAVRYAVALAAALAVAGVALASVVATEPSQQMLNNAAVMALMEAETAGQKVAAEASVEESAPPPFDFGAAGLRYLGGGTVKVGPFASARRYVYENAEGERVVLLAARAWLAGAEPQWSAHRAGPLRLLMWRQHGTRWVIAGNVQTRGLMRAADVATMPSRNGEGS